MTYRLCTLLTVGLLIACNGDPKETDTDDTDTDTTETDTDETDTDETDTDTDMEVAWADMDRAARQTFMTETFMPEIKAIMEGYDPAYASMSCTTCHGLDMSTVDFAMPNTMSPLDGTAFPAPGDSAIVDLMYDDVVTKAVELLGADPFDPNTGTGFGCLGCHATL